MFCSGGHAYVYIIYGLHYCLNVVTRKADEPEAVLIRAVEPLEGIEHMQKRRTRTTRLTQGPGMLCQAFGITKHWDRHLLTQEPLFIASAPRLKPSAIVAVPRVGVDYAGEAAKWPLRFYEEKNTFISKP